METDYIWAAGFLDGEGSFSIDKQKTRGYLNLRSFIKANQAVYPAPIEKLYGLFGGTMRERKARTVTGKRVYEWQVTASADIANTVERILPFLIVKQPLAKLQLELARYQDHRWGRAGSPYHAEWLNIYDRYRVLKDLYHVIEPARLGS